MPGVRLILALHNHQPVGNFGGVFEAAYRDSYLPFLDVLESYPEIPFALHTSGPLLEWLVAHRPEYVGRVRAMASRGQIEILGGGFYEPILTMIPHRDRVGQIRGYAEHLRELFSTPIRGMWTPERVWEQHLVAAIAEAGMEYTILDDFHFRRAGVGGDDLLGYYLTEDEGKLLKIFPGSERLRYLVPFHEPHDTYIYLRELAARRPGCTVVYADDGEKFGSWPDTFGPVYTDGWLRRFCDMIAANRDWLTATTFAATVDATVPMGKVYLPDASYREMTEWALPPSTLADYERVVAETRDHDVARRLRPFVGAGGYWRNFKAKYAETDEMYARMLGISARLAASGSADAAGLAEARDQLYRGQCNCAYWHGSFGGLYLPHLRSAIYSHLIRAENALDAAEGKASPRASIEAGDYNHDARREVRLENDRLVAFFRPAMGGHLYELDHRRTATNVLATLDRRPEAYHAAVAEAASGGSTRGAHGPIILKGEGLGRRLVYDRYPRKALVDHFLDPGATLGDLVAGVDIERGDFVGGTYAATLHRADGRASLAMTRIGRAGGHTLDLRKEISISADSDGFEVLYALDGLMADVATRFSVEFNIAALAGDAPDRYYADADGARLGPLRSTLDLAGARGVSLTDEWLGLRVALGWSRPADLWCVPVETVSQSESGFEGVYQSSAIFPIWDVVADESGHWEVRIDWSLGEVVRA